MWRSQLESVVVGAVEQLASLCQWWRRCGAASQLVFLYLFTSFLFQLVGGGCKAGTLFLFRALNVPRFPTAWLSVGTFLIPLCTFAVHLDWSDFLGSSGSSLCANMAGANHLIRCLV